jgi:hypothetical protein
MDITPFVEALRRDLAHAAEAAGEEARQAADRLAMAMDPSVRLMLMDALSQATSEITNELDGISVEVRLKGREPIFVVVGAPAGMEPPQPPEPPTPPAPEDLEDEGVARITLRLPESLKARAEELAAQRGQSLNTWLVNAARAATADININVNTFGFGPGAPGRNRASSKRIQGWVR